MSGKTVYKQKTFLGLAVHPESSQQDPKRSYHTSKTSKMCLWDQQQDVATVDMTVHICTIREIKLV